MTQVKTRSREIEIRGKQEYAELANDSRSRQFDSREDAGASAAFRKSIQDYIFALHETISRGKSTQKVVNVQRLENQMYLDAKGGMFLSWRFLLMHLVVFFGIGFFFWLLIPWASCKEEVRKNFRLKNPILLFLVPFTMLAPLTPFLLFWLWGETWHSLIELLRANAISGVEVFLPLLLPWALSAHITLELYLVSISKQILWSTFEEFDQLGMFDETIVTARRGAFYAGRGENSAVKNIRKYLESVDSILSFGSLGQIFGLQLDVINSHYTGIDDINWLHKGNAAGLPKEMFYEMTRERQQPRLNTWQNVLITLASIIFAFIPGVFMYLGHGDTYLRNGSPSLIVAAGISFLTLGMISFGYLRILCVRVRHLRIVRQQSALLLYLNASEKSRHAVWRRYYRELSETNLVGDDDETDWMKVSSAKESVKESVEFHQRIYDAARSEDVRSVRLAELLCANIEDHNPVDTIDMEKIFLEEEEIDSETAPEKQQSLRSRDRTMSSELLRRKRTGNIDDSQSAPLVNANERMRIRATDISRLSCWQDKMALDTHQALAQAISHAQFQMLDVEMFIYLRMFFRIYITYENVRMQDFLSASLFVAIIATVHYICSSLVFDGIIGSQIIDIMVVLTFLFTLLTVLDSMVMINSALFDSTIEVLLDWKERVHRVGNQVDMRCPMGALSQTRVMFDHYFDSMIQRVDRTIERIEKMEVPLSLFTVRTSVAARNRFILSVIVAIIGRLCVFVHRHVTLMKPFFSLTN